MPTPTATGIAADVRAGRSSARAQTEAALARIEAVDARLLAYQHVRVFAALREADEVDARPDRAALPLAGVPLAIKDNVTVAGEPMRFGSAGSDPAPRRNDHEIVRRVRAAGAVVVGLTAVPELCVFGTTDSTFGITRNPWDRSRSPGGSSGGSAVAVASGTVPIAHGNDGMGSIRIPAACCGLVGLKPGAGVVPAELGHSSWFGMAENGALATTVDDAALLLSVLAGRPGLVRHTAPGVLRIAMSTRVPASFVPLDRHWRAATLRSADALRNAGHAVVAADPPYGAALPLTELVRWCAGTELDARGLADRNRLTVPVARHAALGRAVLRAGLPHEGGRRRWQRRAEHFFAEWDVLLTPALAQPPPPARRWSERGWLANIVADTRYAPFAAPWNLAGWPAITVPAGLSPTGLPLAVQLVAKPGGESQLLALARDLEEQQPWQRTAELR